MPSSPPSTLAVTDSGLLYLAGAASLQSVYEAENTPELLRWALHRSFVWQRRNDTEVLQATLSMDQGPMWAAALLAWDAQILFDSGETALLDAYTKREVKPEGRPEAVLIRPQTDALRWGHSDVARLPSDKPIVGAVAVVEMDGSVVKTARVALAGVWHRTADRADVAEKLAGQELNAENIETTAQAIAASVTPHSDYLGAEDYRRAMAAVTSRDALTQCLED